jgi:hypothetical protein
MKGVAMRKTVLALLILLIIFSLSRGQDEGPAVRPFSISSLNTPFAMQADFEGEYRIYPDSIEVKVTKAKVRISEHCPYKGRRLLSAVKLGLATGTDGEGWKIAYSAQAFLLELFMTSGETHTLGELYFSIPKSDAVDLSKHWLVIQMEDTVLDVPEEHRLKGYAYAHSCKDIFTRSKQDP